MVILYVNLYFVVISVGCSILINYYLIVGTDFKKSYWCKSCCSCKYPSIYEHLFSILFDHQSIKMSKIERLNSRVEKLLSKAVHEVLEVVKETVSEYQEKTARTQRENQSLKRRLQELQEKLKLKLESNGKTMKHLNLEKLKVICDFFLS